MKKSFSLTKTKNSDNLLVNLLSSISVITIFLSVFISSYFNWAITSIISYPVDDGWCDSSKSGIGGHCFGDFFAPVSIASESPWDRGLNPNPPTAMNVFRMFSYLATVTSDQFALSIWLLIITTCLLIPLIHLNVKSVISSENKFKLNFIYIISMPIITALDRGNIICLTVPLVYFFLISLKEDKTPKKYLIFLVIASLIKPQLIVFSLLLIRTKNISLLIKTVTLWLTLSIISFISYGDFFGDIKKYFKSLLQYPEYASRGKIYPVNLSLRNTLDILDNALGININPALIDIFSYSFLILFTYLTFRNIRSYTLDKCVFNLTLIILSSIGTSFSYYSIYLLLALIMIILNHEDTDLLSTRIIRLPVVGIFLFILPANAFSWKILPIFRDFGQTQISMTWALGQLCILIYFLAEIFLQIKSILKRSKMNLTRNGFKLTHKGKG